MTGRLLLSETVDPDGAMFRWLSADVAAAGWDVLRVPTQEAVHLLGVSPYQAWLVDLAARFRPDVVLAHPPYDHLNRAVAGRLRAGGARLVGLAFDDAIFRPLLQDSGRWERAARDLDAIWDLYLATDPGAARPAARAGLDRVRLLRWAASPGPLAHAAAPPVSEGVLVRSAVLVGRASPRRLALVRALAPGPDDGWEVHVFGHGWPGVDLPAGVHAHGPLTGPEMVGLYRGAAAVVTTGDWEDRAVAMTKFRVVETALAGGYQLAQAAPDLRDYFSADEVPSWETAETLRALVRSAVADPVGARAAADAAQRRALAEHRWARRWDELVALLAEVSRPLRAADDLAAADLAPAEAIAVASCYTPVLAALGHTAEAAGRTRAAAELFGALLERAPGDPAALVGLGRCLYQLGEPALAARHLAAAAAREEGLLAGAAACLHVRVPCEGQPTGLGRAGFLDPRAETVALLLAALADAGCEDDALARLDVLSEDPDRLVTVAALLDLPRAAPGRFWPALVERALAAAPAQQTAVVAAHRARWEAALSAWRSAGAASPQA